MVLTCPTAVVALFIVELNSTLFQDLPTDMSFIPVENHELVVSGAYPQGSIINSSFNNVHLLHIQDDPLHNPYFALNEQSRTLQSKIAINTIQGNTSFIGTFLMAVNKQNQSKVNTLYCVTYCIGNLSDLSMHEACYDSISSDALHTAVNGSLLSQHVYESSISQHASVAYNVLQLSLTPGNKSNVTFVLLESSSRLFFVDDRGVLRTGRQLIKEDIAIHVLTIAVLATISDLPRLELALVTVKVIEENTFPPIFEEPDGYTFSVKEGEQGLSVGFVKAVDRDVGLSGKVVYSFEKQQDTSLFELNDTTGEIKTAVALDRETAESHLFTVVATDQGVPESFNSQVEVRVVVEDINDNRPVFTSKESELVLSLYRQPGPILSLKAEDKDTGNNAMMVYTISQGNDLNLFSINSTSGELFLVAPLTVAANDSIVLVVSVGDILSTNSSFQDTAVVKMTFNDVTSSGARGSDVALISGASVGGVIFIAIIAALGLWLWKRRKSQLNGRKYEAIPVINTDQMPFEYERKIYTVGDTARGSSFEIYPPLRHSAGSPGTPRDSQINLDLSTIENALEPFSLISKRPGLSHSAPSTPTKELRRSRSSHVSLYLTEMRSQSLSALVSPERKTKDWRYSFGSHVSLDLGQVEPECITETAQVSLNVGGMEQESQLISKSDSSGAMRQSGAEMMLKEDASEPRDDLRTSVSGRFRVSLGSSHSLEADTTHQESEIQLIPALLIQKSEGVLNALLQTQESASIINEVAHGSLELGEGEHKSPLLSQSSSEHSRTSSGGSKGNIDLPRDDAFSISSIASLRSLQTNCPQGFQSKPSIDLETHQDASEQHFSTDEHLGRGNLTYAKSATLEVEARGQSYVKQISSSQSCKETPHETVSLPIVIGNNENVTPEGDGKLPIQNLSRSISVPAMAYSSIEEPDQAVRAEIITEAEVESLFVPTVVSTAIQSHAKLQPVKSKKARIPVKVKKAFKLITPEKESRGYSKSQQEGSSDDSDDTTQEPETSTPRKRFPLFGRKKKESSSHRAAPGQRRNALSQAETELGALPFPSTQQENTPVITDQNVVKEQNVRLESASSEVIGEVNEPLKAGSFPLSSGQDSFTLLATPLFSQEAPFSSTSPAITDVVRTTEDASFIGTSSTEGEICASSFATSNTESMLPTTSELVSSESHDPTPLNDVGKVVFHVSQEQDIPYSTNETGPENGPVSSLNEDERSRTVTLSPDNSLTTDGSRGMRQSGAEMMLTEDVSESRDGLRTSLSERSRVSLGSSHSLEADTTHQESEIQLMPESLIQKSEGVLTASLQSQESVAIITKTAHGSLELGEGEHESPLLSQSSSGDSRTSSGGSKGDIDLPRDDASFTPSIGSLRSVQTNRKSSIKLETQQDSDEEYFSTEEHFRRRAIKPHDIVLPNSDTLEMSVKDQPRGVELSSSGSFEDDSLPLHQRNIEDLSKSQSSNTKLEPVKSKKARIPLKVKKAFKFLTSEKEHKQYSKFQQEGSSDDSEDTTQEPETSTPRKRFALFGRKKKKRSSRLETSRRDSLLQTESGVLPVPSTQQENAPVVIDQIVTTDHFPCSTELETRKVMEADTLTEGSVGVASDNGEKLEKVSSRLSKSGESVIRGEDATIESKEIEEFEGEDNIDLSTECAEYSALVIDDSTDSFPEISRETEDIKGNEGDLQEQTLRSESVGGESIGEVVGQIRAGSFISSPVQDSFTSSATPSFSQVASFSTTLPAVTDVLRTIEGTVDTGLEGGSVPSLHEEEHSTTFTLPSDNAVTTDSSAAMPRTDAETMLSEDVSEPQDDLGESASGTFRMSSGSVHEEFEPSCPKQRWSQEGITSTSHVPSESGMTNLSLYSSQSCQQEKLLKDTRPELTQQADLSSSSLAASVRSSSSSREDRDVRPLRQAKPCVVLSDTNI